MGYLIFHEECLLVLPQLVGGSEANYQEDVCYLRGAHVCTALYAASQTWLLLVLFTALSPCFDPV